VLDLRRDAELAREIATRLVEEYAAMLNRRGLPITPGSLYLAHLAGPAGAESWSRLSEQNLRLDKWSFCRS
jgi:hypothetical protein